MCKFRKRWYLDCSCEWCRKRRDHHRSLLLNEMWRRLCKWRVKVNLTKVTSDRCWSLKVIVIFSMLMNWGYIAPLFNRLVKVLQGASPSHFRGLLEDHFLWNHWSAYWCIDGCVCCWFVVRFSWFVGVCLFICLFSFLVCYFPYLVWFSAWRPTVRSVLQTSRHLRPATFINCVQWNGKCCIISHFTNKKKRQ